MLKTIPVSAVTADTCKYIVLQLANAYLDATRTHGSSPLAGNDVVLHFPATEQYLDKTLTNL